MCSRSPLQYINTVFTITITIHQHCVDDHHYNTSTLCSRSPLQYINTVFTIAISIHRHCVHDRHYNTSTLCSRSPLQYINTVFTIAITIHQHCVHDHHYNTSTLSLLSPLQYINTVFTITITIHQHCVHDHHYNTSKLCSRSPLQYINTKPSQCHITSSHSSHCCRPKRFKSSTNCRAFCSTRAQCASSRTAGDHTRNLTSLCTCLISKTRSPNPAPCMTLEEFRRQSNGLER